ncbi:MAG: DUF4136 domain-containing protein [Bacteroidota bacterium]
MIKKRIISGLLVIPLICTLPGCYPDKIEYVDEYDIAATHVNEDADFSEYSTFAVIDTIIHVTDDEEDDPNFDRDHDEFIISELTQNMLDMGYMEVESPDSTNRPDLILLVSAVSSDFYYYYSYYPYYWGWYPGWGYPGWGYPGWGYPGWGYPVYGGSYSTGTLVVDMWDTDEYDPDAEEPTGIIWTGIVDGILAGSSSQTQSRLEKQINQLFTQSPYLQQ